MSSCLGDGENSVENEEKLVYITNVNYTPCAATSIGWVTHSTIDGLVQGKCYRMGYKVVLNSANNMYAAEYVNVLDPEPYDESNLRWGVPYIDADNAIYASAMAIEHTYPTDHFGDSWLLSYNVSLKEGEEEEAYFYYDADNQQEGDGNTNIENKVIIDVRFIKTNVNTENVPARIVNKKIVLKIGQLRDNYSPVYTSEGSYEYANIAVKFRYIQEETPSGKPTEYNTKYLPSGTSWSTAPFILKIKE
ncbi:hypothetical protein D0T57_06280 [Dysgonomonas sp. 511]|nr:hypothetical protein [Dysgonomonas sp. 511]